LTLGKGVNCKSTLSCGHKTDMAGGKYAGARHFAWDKETFQDFLEFNKEGANLSVSREEPFTNPKNQDRHTKRYYSRGKGRSQKS